MEIGERKGTDYTLNVNIFAGEERHLFPLIMEFAWFDIKMFWIILGRCFGNSVLWKGKKRLSYLWATYFSKVNNSDSSDTDPEIGSPLFRQLENPSPPSPQQPPPPSKMHPSCVITMIIKSFNFIAHINVYMGFLWTLFLLNGLIIDWLKYFTTRMTKIHRNWEKGWLNLGKSADCQG